MIQELQLRILPEEAVNEQSLKQVVARETGAQPKDIQAVRVLKRSIRCPSAYDLCECQATCIY